MYCYVLKLLFLITQSYFLKQAATYIYSEVRGLGIQAVNSITQLNLMQTNGGNQFLSDTRCERVTTRVCVPVNCDMVAGQPQCHDKVVPVILQIPEEVCYF